MLQYVFPRKQSLSILIYTTLRIQTSHMTVIGLHGHIPNPDFEGDYLKDIEKLKAEIISKVPEAIDEVDNMRFSERGQ